MKSGNSKICHITARGARGKASSNGGICWSSVALRIVFEEEAMVAFITDPGVGGPEKATTEELDLVCYELVTFTMKQRTRP